MFANGLSGPVPKQQALTKMAEMLCSWKRQEWWKWWVSRTQAPCLPKTLFLQPRLSELSPGARWGPKKTEQTEQRAQNHTHPNCIRPASKGLKGTMNIVAVVVTCVLSGTSVWRPQIALHSVAHRVWHQIPAESEMLRQNRATPPQIKVSHLSLDPPVALSSHLQQPWSQGGCRGGPVEGIAALLGSENGSRYRGCHSYSHTRRATLCN